MKPAIDGRRATRDLARLYGSPPPAYDDALIAGGEEGVEDSVEKGTAKLTSCRDHSTARLPRNWRGRLPSPLSYFKDAVPNMAISKGIGIGHCPMHTDTRRGFLVRLDGVRGTWNCPTCGHGDMVAFVMRLHGVGFVAAVRRLVLGGAA